MIKGILITLLILVGAIIGWVNKPAYVHKNHCTVDDLVEDREAMDKAIHKMGPYYQYTISPDGTLRVDRGDGKWLILHYKKGE
jgi:hypothetical protein